MLDPTFSGNGWLTFDLSTDWDAAYDVALQEDGSSVASSAASNGNKVAVFRVEGTAVT